MQLARLIWVPERSCRAPLTRCPLSFLLAVIFPSAAFLPLLLQLITLLPLLALLLRI